MTLLCCLCHLIASTCPFTHPSFLIKCRDFIGPAALAAAVKQILLASRQQSAEVEEVQLRVGLQGLKMLSALITWMEEADSTWPADLCSSLTAFALGWLPSWVIDQASCMTVLHCDIFALGMELTYQLVESMPGESLDYAKLVPGLASLMRAMRAIATCTTTGPKAVPGSTKAMEPPLSWALSTPDGPNHPLAALEGP